MADNRGAHAPYNFAPFSSKVEIPYHSAGELPGHHELRADLKSGEIRMTLRAQTPVFVSDGDPEGDGQRRDLHFFRGPDGRCAIPGSTVRGMVRENMQILGFGLIRPGEDLEDYQIFFRAMTDAKESVGAELKRDYAAALDVQSVRDPATGKMASVPRKVASGYLSCRNGSYEIRPTAEPFFRVSREMEDVQRFGGDPARTVPVAYQAEGGVVKRILPAGEAPSGMRRGVLLYTGLPVGGRKNAKPNHLYLFPEADPEADPIPVEPQDLLSYRVDLENRANNLTGTYGSPDFWKLPGEGEERAVFYARYDGHLYFGRSVFLRIGYRYPLSEGLPRRHRDELKIGGYPLDYPHAILGFAAGTEAYRSRVSFGDFAALGSPRELEKRQMILSGPKPSFYPGYVTGGKNYNQLDPGSEEDRDRFQLRGYKQYWLQPPRPTAVPDGKERVGTTLRPLPEGTEFQGTIRFDNLTDLELGLLLWSLRLEEGCFQTIGMGRPYGYGRMRPEITALRVLDPERLYGGGLAVNPWRDETEQVGRYIDAYDGGGLSPAGKKKKAARVRERPEIQDFFFLKRSVRGGEETSYMDLNKKEYQNVQRPLPTVREIREGEEAAAAPAAEAAAADPLEALRNKFRKL